MYRIRVKDDWRWPTARVSGREFTKRGSEFADESVNDEIRNSSLLIVELAQEEAPAPKRGRPRKVVSDDDSA